MKNAYSTSFLLHLTATRTRPGYWQNRGSTAYAEALLGRIDSDLNCSIKSYQCGEACIPKTKECRLNASQLQRIVNGHESKIRNLGYEQAVVISPATGRVIFAASGDKTSINLSNAQVKAMKGAVFTHNHPNLGWNKSDPRSRGLGFSKDDLQVASVAQVSEMRAVSRGYNHSVKAPRSGWSEQYWEKKLSPVYDKNYQSVYSNSVREIILGQKSAAQVEADFHHEVMRRTSRELGLVYDRRKV